MTERRRRALAELGPRFGLDRRPDRARRLVLEVGCGMGEAAVAHAIAHPDVDTFAVDVHTAGIATLLERRAVDGPDNLYVERADGLDVLDHRLGTGSLAGLLLFFPDPWPKARHHKRRFVRPDVLDLVADRLARGGAFLVATDDADYAEWAVEHLDDHPAFDGGRADRPAWRPITRYEQAGLDAGREIVDLAYRRR